MADKMYASYPALYDAIKAKLWEARRNARDHYDDEPGAGVLLGAAEFAELVLNWHMPSGSYDGRPCCQACTGENIVSWPCEYTLQIAGHVGIEVDRG